MVCSGGSGYHHFGVLRVPHVHCDVIKPFVWNNEFRINNKGIRKLLKGVATRRQAKEIYLDILRQGHLPFSTEGEEYDCVNNYRGYKTMFGPVFYSGAVCYRKDSVVNLAKAFRRMTAARAPERIGYDGLLRHNQSVNVTLRNNSMFGLYLRHWYKVLRQRITLSLSEVCKDMYTYVKEQAYIPHLKKRIRVNAHETLAKNGYTYDFSLYTKKIIGKLKVPEWAKPGKYPRLIGDYSTPGSLVGAYIARIKHSFEEWYCTFDNLSKCRFVFSPVKETLVSCFTELWENSTQMVCVFHSDDSCISIPCTDGVFKANLDISSCDMSNGRPIFDMILEFVKGCYCFPIIKCAVDQCSLPFTLYNPYKNGEKITFEATYKEYSGSCLTTLLNNIAVSVIWLSIVTHCRGKTCAELRELILQSAEYVGYIVTIDQVFKLEDYQFLKVSPFKNASGEMDVFLNLGVILRSLGSSDGDVPKSKDGGCRFILRNCEIIEGMKHAGEHSVLQELRKRWPSKNCKALSVHHWVDALVGFETSRVDDLAICNRYSLAQWELDELLRYIRECGVGDFIYCSALRKIYKKDYDL